MIIKEGQINRNQLSGSVTHSGMLLSRDRDHYEEGSG